LFLQAVLLSRWRIFAKGIVDGLVIDPERGGDPTIADSRLMNATVPFRQRVPAPPLGLNTFGEDSERDSKP
jgi:hypothetical protein